MPDPPENPARQHAGPTLAALAARAATGDREAFDAIHQRLAPGLRRLLLERTGGNLSLTDDLSQRAWAGVWQALAAGRYDPARSAISTFAYAVATKAWIQHLRERGRSDDRIDAAAALGLFTPGTENPSDSARLAEVMDAIRAAMDGRSAEGAPPLTEQERWLLRASVEGQSDRALARHLGVSASTAHEARKAAFDKLRRLLAALGFRPEGGERTASGGE